MIFIDNKYTRWYYGIIENVTIRASTRKRAKELLGYVESHHIIPKSLGGSNNTDNIAHLSAREHFICHWLLTKMVEGNNRHKMIYACKGMMHRCGNRQKRYKVNAHLYELLRRRLSQKLIGKEVTDETKQKLKIAARKRADNESEEQRKNRGIGLAKYNRSRKGVKKPQMRGENNPFYGKGLSGELNPFYGKKHTEETLAKLRIPAVKCSCIYCHRLVGGLANLQRWHGDNCPANPNNPNFNPELIAVRSGEVPRPKKDTVRMPHSSKIEVSCICCRKETRLNQITRAHGIGKCC